MMMMAPLVMEVLADVFVNFYYNNTLIFSTLIIINSRILNMQTLTVKNNLANVNTHTGLFISPSGISNLCGTAARMVTPKGSMSTEGERLQVSVVPYRCSICPPLVTWQMSIL
jgi:hypothetical protein